MSSSAPRGRPAGTLAGALRRTAGRIVFAVAVTVIGVVFALPLAWLLVAPFDASPTMSVKWPRWTLSSFHRLMDNPYALGSIVNSLIIALGTMAVVIALGTLASYALSRVRVPGRDAILYAMLQIGRAHV